MKTLQMKECSEHSDDGFDEGITLSLTLKWFWQRMIQRIKEEVCYFSFVDNIYFLFKRRRRVEAFQRLALVVVG